MTRAIPVLVALALAALTGCTSLQCVNARCAPIDASIPPDSALDPDSGVEAPFDGGRP